MVVIVIVSVPVVDAIVVIPFLHACGVFFVTAVVTAPRWQ